MDITGIIDYPDWYPELDEEKVDEILKHCEKYSIEPEVCAYYSDWKDFCSDWCDIVGYTRSEARERFQDGIQEGEFMEFKDWGILRFVL